MQVVIWGAGGHGKVVYDVVTSVPGCEVVAWLDDRHSGGDRYGAPILPADGLRDLQRRFPELHAIVALGVNALRARIAAQLRADGMRLLTAVHATAIVHRSVELGPGTVVMPGAIINIDTSIGDNCIVNTGATIDHDCRLEANVHVAPGVHLAGTVNLGEGAFLGIGSCVLPGRTVGAWSTIGAGAVVISDIPDRVTAVGIPCRIVGEGGRR